MSPLRWFLTYLSFATAIGVSWYVVASGWPEGGAPLGLPWWAHLSALGLVGLEVLFRVTKLHLSARAVRLSLSMGVATRTCLGGDFASSITPSRSGGEPARFLVLTEAGMGVSGVLLVLFLELFLELLSLLILMLAFVLFLDLSERAVATMIGLMGAYAAVVIGGAVAFTIASRKAAGPPPRWAVALGVGAGLWRKFQRALRHVRGSVNGLKTAHRGTMALALAASVLHVVVRLAILPLILHAYGEHPPMAPVLVWPLALQYGAAVAPAPAGGGVVEFGFRVVLNGTISPRLMGTSLIWWRVYVFYIYVVLGALAAGRTVMKALRRASQELAADP